MGITVSKEIIRNKMKVKNNKILINFYFQIFVKDKQIQVQALQSVKNVNEIVQLLKEVSRFLSCFESDAKRFAIYIFFIFSALFLMRLSGTQVKLNLFQIC